MAAIVRTISQLINKLPERWRNKILFWAATGGISFLVKLIWGPGVLLVGLLIISCAGWLLYQYGVRHSQHADALLGNVWDYFRGAILFALLPALWTALKELLTGDRLGGLIQLLVLAFLVAFVFDQFSRLPRSWIAWTDSDGQRKRPSKAKPRRRASKR